MNPSVPEVDRQTGWCRGISCHPSPHCDARPDADDISLLVIHGISLPAGVFTGDAVRDLFLGQLDCGAHSGFADLAGVRVSAHFFIRRDGQILQFVSCRERAWHAGVSRFDGRERCNDFSIGVELEGTDTQPYTDHQYTQLVVLTRALQQAYPRISRARIVGHEHIAPVRKTDPGPAFDWPRLLWAL